MNKGTLCLKVFLKKTAWFSLQIKRVRKIYPSSNEPTEPKQYLQLIMYDFYQRETPRKANAWNGNQRPNFTSHKETADKLDFHLVCLQSEQPCAGSYFAYYRLSVLIRFLMYSSCKPSSCCPLAFRLSVRSSDPCASRALSVSAENGSA